MDDGHVPATGDYKNRGDDPDKQSANKTDQDAGDNMPPDEGNFFEKIGFFILEVVAAGAVATGFWVLGERFTTHDDILIGGFFTYVADCLYFVTVPITVLKIWPSFKLVWQLYVFLCFVLAVMFVYSGSRPSKTPINTIPNTRVITPQIEGEMMNELRLKKPPTVTFPPLPEGGPRVFPVEVYIRVVGNGDDTRRLARQIYTIFTNGGFPAHIIPLDLTAPETLGVRVECLYDYNNPHILKSLDLMFKGIHQSPDITFLPIWRVDDNGMDKTTNLIHDPLSIKVGYENP